VVLRALLSRTASPLPPPTMSFSRLSIFDYHDSPGLLRNIPGPPITDSLFVTTFNIRFSQCVVLTGLSPTRSPLQTSTSQNLLVKLTPKSIFPLALSVTDLLLDLCPPWRGVFPLPLSPQPSSPPFLPCGFECCCRGRRP